MLRATLIGLLSYAFWLVSASVVGIVLGMSVALASATAFDAFYNTITGTLWAGLILNGALLFGAGYVASASVRQRKVETGFLLGIVFILLAVTFRVIHGPWNLPESATGSANLWMGIVGWASPGLFPVLGAVAAHRGRKRGVSAGWHNILAVPLAYQLLLLGLITLAGSALVVWLYPGELGAGETVVLRGLGFPPWLPLLLVPGVGLLLTALAALMLVRLRGRNEGLIVGPAPIAIYVWVILWAGLFAYRDRTTRPEPERVQLVVEKINAQNSVPPEENGARLYRNAFSLLSTRGASDRYLDVVSGTLEEQGAVISWLSDEQRAISMALKAAEKESTYFRLRLYKDAPALKKGELKRAGILSRLLCAEFLRLTAQGRIHQGFARAEAAFRLGTSLRGRSTSAVLIGESCRQIVLHSVHHAMVELDLSRDDLKTIRYRLRKWDELPFVNMENFAQSIHLERVSAIEQLSAATRRGGILSYLSSLFLRKQLIARELQSVNQQILKPGSLLGARRKAEEITRDLPHLWPISFGRAPVPTLRQAARSVAATKLPDYTKIINSLLSGEATLRILKASAGARLAGSETPGIPRDWAALVPEYVKEVPQDPFAEGPLHLRERDGAILIYSVGPNLQDDGGEGWLFRDPQQTVHGSAQEEPADLTCVLFENKKHATEPR